MYIFIYQEQFWGKTWKMFDDILRDETHHKNFFHFVIDFTLIYIYI